MFKKFRLWMTAAAAATVGFVGGIQWDQVKNKMEETGAKSQCEARVQADICSIDQACRWDFDAKVCVEKK